MGKMRTILFATTGFGNSAFRILAKIVDVQLTAVFTPKRPDGPFPYYACPQLQDEVLAYRGDIKLFEGLSIKSQDTLKTIKGLSPDLIVVSTFNQIIPKDVVLVPKLGVINIHPSLLPMYRGATPTVWAILNGERETGVSAHFIEDESIDKGRIITQYRVKIEDSDTDGFLRKKLAEFSEKVLSEAIRLVLTKKRVDFPEQDESKASYYPKRTIDDARIDVGISSKEVLNKVRAMTPYPGARIRCDNVDYIVTSASLTNFFKKDEILSSDGSGTIYRETLDGYIEFKVRKA